MGAFLALGLTPLALPAAHADFEDLFDPGVFSFADDPTAALGAAFSSPAADNAIADAFQTDFWLPIHGVLQDWITSDVGQ